MTPYMTQIKFYIASENRYYGFCNKAKYFCYWTPDHPLLGYVNETTFNEKQIDVSAVYATGLDDMTLTDVPTSSDNPQVGCKILVFVFFTNISLHSITSSFLI